MPFYDPYSVSSKELVPGATLRPIWGENLMMVHLTLENGAVVPLHNHHQEQAGIVLEGEFELTIGNEKKILSKGDAYLIPSNVEHTAVANSGKAIALDIFSPPREEYK